MAGLGETLKAARLAKGLSLEDAEHACRVRRIFLEALEEERYDLLPPRAFAQGLLTVYARYLDLDPYPLTRLLPPEPTVELEVLPPPPAPRAAPWRAGVLAGVFLLAIAAGYAYIQAENTGSIEPPQPGNLLVTLPTATAPTSPTATPQVTTTPEPTGTVTPTATAVPTVPVPALTGRPLAQAVGALQAAGLQGTTEERSSADVPAGTVMEQQPAAGATLSRGQTVSLVVSRGPPPVTVPNVVGQAEAAARAAITAARLAPGQFTNYQGRADVPPADLGRVCVGCVLSTTPGPGAEVAPGTQVLIAVRRE